MRMINRVKCDKWMDGCNAIDDCVAVALPFDPREAPRTGLLYQSRLLGPAVLPGLRISSCRPARSTAMRKTSDDGALIVARSEGDIH